MTIGRRRFLRSGAAAAAGVAALGARAADPPRPAEPAEAPARPVASLPPAPGPDLYRARLAAARERMETVGAQVVLEMPGPNMRYLTGIDLDETPRPVTFVLPRAGEPTLFVPEYAADEAIGPAAIVQDVRAFDEDDDPMRLLEKHLKKIGSAAGRIAIGGETPYDDFARIHAELPKLEFISSTPIVGLLRETKSLEEIAIIRAAAGILQRAIDAGLAAVREGMSERDLREEIARHAREGGAEAAGTVLFGVNTSRPAAAAGDRALAPGDVVQIGFGARVHGYWANLSRVAVFGEPTGRMNRIYEILRKAQTLAIERAAPGVPCSGVELIARAAIGNPGFLKFIRHDMGRGVGLERIEPPYISRANHDRLSRGNVSTLEPAVYTPGDYGLRLGDLMEVTAGGSRLMTEPPPTLLRL